MRVTIKSAAAAVLGLALSFGSVAAGETVSYTGSGTYTAHKLTMTLGGGDIVFTGWNEGIATISTDPPTLLYGKCMALGIVSGAEGDFSNDVYCTFRANDADSFDIKARSDAKGGIGAVIGGGGRWAGATGTVRMTRTSQNENSGTYEFELEITTP